jgi:very-short-patch-repair endonuclease
MRIQFYRQKPIGDYIAGFLAYRMKLAALNGTQQEVADEQ